jgi:hypothetical protein
MKEKNIEAGGSDMKRGIIHTMIDDEEQMDDSHMHHKDEDMHECESTHHHHESNKKEPKKALQELEHLLFSDEKITSPLAGKSSSKK